MGGKQSSPAKRSSANPKSKSIIHGPNNILEQMYKAVLKATGFDDRTPKDDEKLSDDVGRVAPQPPPRRRAALRAQQDHERRMEKNLQKLNAKLKAARKDVNVASIWESFFAQAFLVGERAIRSGLLDIDDVLDEEPFLYFGLTGAVVLETILRSLSADGLVLADGTEVTAETCPAEHKPLFDGMFAIKLALLDTGVSSDPMRMRQLQRIVLYASSDKPNPVINDESVRVALNRVASLVQSVATRISQMAEFLKRFADVLRLLADSYEDRPSMTSTNSATDVHHEVAADVEQKAEQKAEQKVEPASEAKEVAATSPADEDRLWSSILNSLFDVAQRRMESGMLGVKDMQQRRDATSLGLAASTLLEAIQRSVNSEGLVLTVGDPVLDDSCPPAHADSFAALMGLKSLLIRAELGAAELNELRRMVLHAEMRPQLGTAAQKELMVQLSQGLIRMARTVVNLPLFQQQYAVVEEMLAALAP